ncbi:MAG TPA: alpha/beta fold hydrolase, partial [Candidatus Binataceae bacterium]|nr:alpha/beta fold hydrolase [Candidatus Binataceae bacterium]
PRCQADNRAERKFCASCGAPLGANCPNCGFENAPGEKFCGGCGKALGGEPAPPSKPEPTAREVQSQLMPKDLAAKILKTRGQIEGERRQVTVLFCDLARSTEIAERLDPETDRELLNEYLEGAIRTVYRYEGVVTEIAGDGFMAIFGAPVAHDDDPARACRAALEIMAGLDAVGRKWKDRVGHAIAARIGLNSGPVVVGTVGNDLRMDYTAIGDTINVASRIQTSAQPGQICLSEAARKLVAPRFETEEVGRATFKGKSAETTVFRLVREVPRQERRHQALRSGLSHFCGRRSELAMLRERFDTAREGDGQVVLLSGEAGIGKSRLVYEFRRSLDADTYTWLEGQCMSYGTVVAYHPFLDLLRGAFEIDESDTEPVIIDKINRFCAGLGPKVSAGVPFLRDLLSVDSGDARVATMLESLKAASYSEAIRDLILALAAQRPVVLLMEDVHWVDQSSATLLRWLFDSIAGARVFALVTHRPDYNWPFPVRSYFSRISLHGLPASLVDELTGSVLGRSDLPGALKRLIAERSDGNPFFVEELAKSISEMGAAAQRTDGALAEAVPATLQQVIMARIDRLDEEGKHALQIASVIGREFAMRIFDRMRDWQGSSESSLEKLRSLELIYEKTVHPELAYMFKHALTHDVAYGTLLRAQRRDIHRRVAALIEEIYAERLPEFYETLAYHFEQGEMPERAAHYALLSGEREASALSPEAEHHFQRAIALAAARPGCEEIVVKAQSGFGDLMLLTAQTDRANAAYNGAISAAKDPETARRIRNKLVQRKFVTRDGVRIAYYLQGSGGDGSDRSATPIVMFHPMLQGSAAHAPLALRLCQQFPVAYIDPRGLGASDKPNEPYDFDVRVADALAVLRELPFAKFILWGDSDGVPSAVRMYHGLPGRIEKMILFGGMARIRQAPDYPIGATDEQIREVMDRFFADDYRAGLDAFFSDGLNEPGLSAWKDRLVDIWFQNIPRQIFIGFLQQTFDIDERDLFRKVDAPTLVIAGQHDILVPPRHARYVADLIPGAQFALIKGAGHSAMATATDTFLEIVTTFIRTGTLPKTEWEARPTAKR